ncbi:MAG: PP2C family protein-serine/threonine phosphatase [Hyphomicrobiaceae bacterium]
MSFAYGLSATKGQRGYQEDSAAVWPGNATFSWSGDALPPPPAASLLAVLADGMGGHVGGALASMTVCEAFVQTYATSGSALSSVERARVSLLASNQRIADAVRNDPALAGMGSTLVAAIFEDGCLDWISVGDSPLYLYRRGEIALLNEDHSLAPALDKMAADGEITQEQARNDPRRHMLRSAITGDVLDLVDISQKPLALEADDFIIIASDGIHTLELTELVRIISGYSADGPLGVSSAIVRAINNCRDPYQDNATVVVVQPRE